MAIGYARARKNPKIRLRPRQNPLGLTETLLLINPRNPCGRRNPAEPKKPKKKPSVKRAGVKAGAKARAKKAISSEELRKPRPRPRPRGKPTHWPKPEQTPATAAVEQVAKQAAKIEKQKAQISRLKKGEKKMAKAKKVSKRPKVSRKPKAAAPAAAAPKKRKGRPKGYRPKVVHLTGRRISYLRKGKRVIRHLPRKKRRKVAAKRKPVSARKRIRAKVRKKSRGWRGIKAAKRARRTIRYHTKGIGRKSRASGHTRAWIKKMKMRTNPGFADIKALLPPIGIALLAFIVAGALPKIGAIRDYLAKPETNENLRKFAPVIGAAGIAALAYFLTRKGTLAKFQIPALIGAGMALGISILKVEPVKKLLPAVITDALSDYVPVGGYGYGGYGAIERAGGVVDTALLEQGGYIPQQVADYIEQPAAYAGYVEQLSADVQEALTGTEVEEGLAGVSAAEALSLSAGGRPVQQTRDVEMDEITAALNKGSLAGSSL